LTTYFRSSQDFGWYKGGSHNDGELNPGGGTIQMVIKDGKVGIGTASPSEKLEVNGNVILGSGSTSIERIVIGTVDSNGNKTSGSGFTSERINILGASPFVYEYEIKFSQEFSSIPVILANAILKSKIVQVGEKKLEFVSNLVFVNPFDITKGRARIMRQMLLVIIKQPRTLSKLGK